MDEYTFKQLHRWRYELLQLAERYADKISNDTIEDIMYMFANMGDFDFERLYYTLVE